MNLRSEQQCSPFMGLKHVHSVSLDTLNVSINQWNTTIPQLEIPLWGRSGQCMVPRLLYCSKSFFVEIDVARM